MTTNAIGDPAPNLSAPPSALRRLAPRSFRATIVASTVVAMTLAMAIVVLGIQVVLAYTAQRDIRQVLDDRSSAMVTVIEQASQDRLTVPADALEPGMVVYDAAGRQVAGSVESDAREAAGDLSTTRSARTTRSPGDEERLLGTPFTTPSGESGVLVVSQETTPYERSELYALIATIALAVLVIGGTAFVALRVTKQALRPVAQMAQRAADWSEHDLTHRFAMGPPSNELAALGETLDHLLDRVASAIRSEQRLTSELAHELRTPLTAIKGTADVALLAGVGGEPARESFSQISSSARDMAGVISTLLDVARDGTTAARGQTSYVSDLIPGLKAAAGSRVAVIVLTNDSTARIAAPKDLVIRAVSPVIDNAARHARHEIVIEAVDSPDRVDLVVSDDGDGIDAGVRDTLFEPGVSEREGGGLGLGIARRVARSFGGDVALDPDPDGRAIFRISLPRR